MGQDMYIEVRITEKASGRIITYSDPEDEYYPFDTECGLIPKTGFSEICCLTEREVLRRAEVVSRNRDAVLSAEQLRGIHEAMSGENVLLGAFVRLSQGSACGLPEEWLAEEIPDFKDAQALTAHPERYGFEFVLTDINV